MNLFQRFSKAWKQATEKRNVEAGDLNRLLADWVRSGLSADKSLEKDLAQTVARSRDLHLNNPYVQQWMTLLVNNVLGPHGMRMQAQVRNNDGNLAKPINDKIESAYRDWQSSVTLDGMTLNDFENLLLETIAIDGEAFVVEYRTANKEYNRHNYALQLIDADQVDRAMNIPGKDGQNEVRMGIELDPVGRVAAYHVWPRHPSEMSQRDREKRTRIPANRVIHLFRKLRAGQTRGLPWAAAAMTSLRMLHGYEEAELVAARTAAAKMGWVTLDGESTPDDLQSGGSIPMEANPGQIGILPQGATFTNWDPQHPTTAFPAFIKQSLRKIASGLRVFYNALANDLEGVNYSSMRSGVQIERDTWRMLQTWLVRNWRGRIYRPWLEQSILSGVLVVDSRSPDKLAEVKWTPRGFDWVDPEKDVDTAIKEIANGLNSRTRILAAKGEAFEDILEQLAEEEQLLKQYTVKLTGDTVTGGQPSNPEQEAAPADKKEDDAESGRMMAGIERIVGAIREQKPAGVNLNFEKLAEEMRLQVPDYGPQIAESMGNVVDAIRAMPAPVVNLEATLDATLRMPERERVITERDARGLPSKVVERDVEVNHA